MSKIWVAVLDGGPVEESHFVTICEIDESVLDDYNDDAVHYSEVISSAHKTYSLKELIDNIEFFNAKR